MAVPIQLPTIQNWSCHNCGGCCRQHLIEVTEEERRRIVSQNWTAADGMPASTPALVWFAGPPWKKRYRLGHQADGACVFLNEQGLCRIHAKFGEAAKPLPCRLYPYAFHPGGRKAAVSLRFSCPSVVANRGRAVTDQAGPIKRLADEVVPAGAGKTEPPALSHRSRVDWPDFQRFVSALDETLASAGRPLLTRLLEAVFWVRLVGQSKFDAIQGERIGEYLKLVTEAARSEIAARNEWAEPSRAGKLQFRMICAQYARRDTMADVGRGVRGRIALLRAAMRFAKGRGEIPLLQPAFGRATFEQLEVPWPGWNAEMDEILTRYFRVKIQGLHFCGRAYYDVPFTEGFFSLALVFPVVMWMARWLAASAHRPSLVTDDVANALAIVDHHHGYSPMLGGPGARRRVRLLTLHDDLERLCAHYSRSG